MIFDVFGQFLASRRPGRCLKTFLEAVRFISTEFEPVARHHPPNHPHFDAFEAYILRPTSHLSKTFVEKVDPICLLRPNRYVKNIPTLILQL